MKKITIILLTFFVFSFVNAQEIEDEKEYNNQLTFGVLGNTGLLVYKYGFDKKYSKRITLSGYFQNLKGSIDRPIGPGIDNLDSRLDANISLGYGLQKNIAVHNKIDFFYAMDFVLGTSYRNSINGWEVKDSTAYSEFIEDFGYGSYSNYSDNDFYKTQESYFIYSLGLRPAVGLNFKLIDRLLLGLEYRVSILTVNYFSGYKYSLDSFTNGEERSLEKQDDSDFEFRSSLNGNAAVTITYLF